MTMIKCAECGRQLEDGMEMIMEDDGRCFCPEHQPKTD
jgi:DNA-directed RNA polymerase subunit RPC12/RpoP